MRSKEVDKSIKSLENFVNQKYYNGVTAEEMKTVLAYIEELENKVIMLDNTKNICPALNTSGALCPIKAITSGEPIENALVMPDAENVSKEINENIYRRIKETNRFNNFNGMYEK